MGFIKFFDNYNSNIPEEISSDRYLHLQSNLEIEDFNTDEFSKIEEITTNTEDLVFIGFIGDDRSVIKIESTDGFDLIITKLEDDKFMCVSIDQDEELGYYECNGVQELINLIEEI